MLAQGGSFGGISFFVNKDQKLQYSHNYMGLEEYKVIAKEKIPTGKATLRMEFQVTGPPDFKVGKGAPGIVRLFANGKKVGEGKIAVTCPLAYSLSGDGLCCGRDTLTPVSADYHAEYPFTGTIHQVTVNLEPTLQKTPEPPVHD